MQNLPSPLDSPRFFDDAALSAWSVGDRHFAAARKSVSAKSLVYSYIPTTPRLRPEDSSDAISVELVRGSNGPADAEWTVLVDGIRCRKLETILQDGDATFRCVLPPGVAPPNPNKKDKTTLDTDTKVRPVVVGIRLEEEALAPASATLVIEQVLDTSERSGQDPDTPDTRTLKTIQLTPYRVSDLQSNAVVLQYPFHSPAQSVLAILSMKNQLKWKAEEKLKGIWNAITPILNVYKQSNYNEEMRLKKPSPSYRVSASVPEQAAQRFFARRRHKDLKLSVPTPEPLETTQTFRIGGGKVSSARALGDLFATLSQVCTETRSIANDIMEKVALDEKFVELIAGFGNVPGEEDGDGDSVNSDGAKIVIDRLHEHLRVMEVALIGNHDTNALALLSTLCTADANHAVRGLLGPDNNFTKVSNKIIEESLPANMTEDNTPYFFTYERLLLDTREKTTVETRFKVVVDQEDGNEPLIVEFVSDRQDGFVANSVYSGEIDDVQYMDKEATRFKNCLIHGKDETAEDASTSASVYPEAFSQQTRKDDRKFSKAQTRVAVFQTVKKRETYIQQLRAKNPETTIANIETHVGELKVVLKRILPVWPTPSPTEEDYKEIAQLYKESQEATETALKKMIEDEDDTSLSDQEEQVSASSSSEQHWCVDGSTTKRKTTSVGGMGEFKDTYFLPPAKQKVDNALMEEAKKELADEAKKLADEEEKRFIEQIEAIKKADQEDGYSTTYKAAKREDLLIRQLPQIVKPKTVAYISFQLPKSISPPDYYEVYRPPVATPSWWRAYFPSLGTTVQITGIMVAVYYTLLGLIAQAQTKKFEFGANMMIDFYQLFTENPRVGILKWLATLGQKYKKMTSFLIASLVTDMLVLKKFVPKMWEVGEYILLQSRDRIANSKTIEKDVNKHFKKNRDIPVKDAFAAATNAVSKWRKSEERRIASLSGGVTKDASVVYNPVTGKRFRFLEYFQLDGNEIVEYKRLYTGTAWVSASDVNAFRILPPSDVDEAYVQCIDQREMPFAQTISFVTGSSYSYSRPYAQAAFSELYNTVMLSLKTMHSGQRVEQSGHGLALDLVKQGALVMKTVFGKAAGVTLVTPDDILWTCLRASTFARLALRHLAVFSDAQYTTNNSNDFVKKSIEFWKSNRRQAVDQFADALIIEARNKAAQDAYAMPLANVAEDSRIESKRRYDRVRALLTPAEVSTEETSLIMSVVASSVHIFQMPAMQGGVCDEEAATTARRKTSMSNTVPNFEYQASLQPPNVQKRNDVAAWASRRVDTSLGRSMCLGNGAESVLSAFASLDLGTNTGNAVTFYCPAGSRLNAVPASVPFDTDGINKRVVWTSALREAAENILFNIQSAPLDANSWHIDAQHIGQNKEIVGFARHPAALQTKANRISVQLSGQFESVSYTKRVVRMRRVAYNADRIFFALSLAYSYPQDTTLCIKIPHQDVACLAIAVAMCLFEGGVPDIALWVYPDNVEESRTAMQKLVAQATAACKLGCKVVSLAEVAMCV